jgi:hypothetical protein
MSLEINITGIAEIQKRLNSFPDVYEKESRITIKEQIADTREYASNNHSYMTQGGLLDKSYIEEYPNSFEGSLVLDKMNNNAPYSYAIHSGRKDWPNYTPSLFVDNAYNVKKTQVETELMGVGERALKKAGLA